MGLNLKEAKEIREEIAKKGGEISRAELCKLIAEKTGTIMPWWITNYIKAMAAVGLIELTENGFRVK